MQQASRPSQLKPMTYGEFCSKHSAKFRNLSEQEKRKRYDDYKNTEGIDSRGAKVVRSQEHTTCPHHIKEERTEQVESLMAAKVLDPWMKSPYLEGAGCPGSPDRLTISIPYRETFTIDTPDNGSLGSGVCLNIRADWTRFRQLSGNSAGGSFSFPGVFEPVKNYQEFANLYSQGAFTSLGVTVTPTSNAFEMSGTITIANIGPDEQLLRTDIPLIDLKNSFLAKTFGAANGLKVVKGVMLPFSSEAFNFRDIKMVKPDGNPVGGVDQSSTIDYSTGRLFAALNQDAASGQLLNNGTYIPEAKANAFLTETKPPGWSELFIAIETNDPSQSSSFEVTVEAVMEFVPRLSTLGSAIQKQPVAPHTKTTKKGVVHKVNKLVESDNTAKHQVRKIVNGAEKVLKGIGIAGEIAGGIAALL